MQTFDWVNGLTVSGMVLKGNDLHVQFTDGSELVVPMAPEVLEPGGSGPYIYVTGPRAVEYNGQQIPGYRSSLSFPKE